jgi:hypothetical protein
LKEHIAKLRAKQNSYMEVIAKFTIQGILWTILDSDICIWYSMFIASPFDKLLDTIEFSESNTDIVRHPEITLTY